MKAMILAAGRGKRLRPLTDTIPKPLIKIAGHSLIEYRLQALAKAGINEVVINVAYQAKQIIQALGDGRRYGVDIHYSCEPETGALETGGGVYQALPLLGEQPFLVLNSDYWTDYPLSQLPQQLDGLAHLVLVDKLAEQQHGDFNLQGNRVVDDADNPFTLAGINVYHPALFADCQAGIFSVVPLLRKAMRDGLVTGEYYPGQWHHVSSLEHLQRLRQQLAVDEEPNGLSESD